MEKKRSGSMMHGRGRISTSFRQHGPWDFAHAIASQSSNPVNASATAAKRDSATAFVNDDVCELCVGRKP